MPGGGTSIDVDDSGSDDGGDEEDDGLDSVGDGVNFDLPGGGASAGDEGPSGEGCQKVDFLFVIDSSPSMEDEQENLLASFPGFMTAIEDTLEVNDFHLMVVDAGELDGADCDGTLGAGRVTSGSGADCGIEGGQRFATHAQNDLAAAFACMANRGDSGPSNERTMDALQQSIGLQSLAGGCNEGFLRQDAILVVTLITDEEDDPGDAVDGIPALDGSCGPVDADPNSSGDAASWKHTVVSLKNEDEAAIVVLGLLGDCDIGGCPGMALTPFGGSALTGAEPAPRLRSFVDSFAQGNIGPICAPDYAPFFSAAVGVIDSACTDFIPPG